MRLQIVFAAVSVLFSQSVGAQSYTSRGYPGEPTEAKIVLSESAEPIWYPVESPRTLEEIIDEVCGNQPPAFREYMHQRAMKLNDEKFPNRRIEAGSVVAVPFCHKVEFELDVLVEAGDSLYDIAMRHMGVTGQKTLASIVALNGGSSDPSPHEIEEFAASLRAGQRLRLPFGTTERVLHQIPGRDAPREIISEHPPERFELMAALNTVTPTNAPRTNRLEPVGFVPASSEVSTLGCPGTGGTPPSAPFDIDDVRARLDAEKAFLISSGAPPTQAVVGIIDNGVRTLGNSFFARRLFVPNNAEGNPFAVRGSDDDRNGHTDDIWGSNFTARDGVIEAFGGDNSQHGTRMSALALGGVDFVRSLPATELPLVRIRIVNFSSTVRAGLMDPSFFPEAVHYLAQGVEPHASILNVSLSSSTNFTPIRNAIHSHPEVLFVVAAANNLSGGRDLSIAPEYPARLSGDHDFVSNLVTVASHEPGGGHARHSNWGVNVDLHAPGCAIETVHTDGNVVTETGSSVAAAIVSFTAGLVRALGGAHMPPEKIRQRLIAGSDMDPDLEGLSWTTGRLNVVKTISLTHDVIEMANASPYTFGRLHDMDTLRIFCAENNLRTHLENIVKVRPNLKGDGTDLMIEYWVESPPRVGRIRCTQQKADESIGLLVTENGAEDGPPMADVVDIVTASLRIPPFLSLDP